MDEYQPPSHPRPATNGRAEGLARGLDAAIDRYDLPTATGVARSGREAAYA
ncbi:hypothetical protein [Paracoccus sp. S3-43]|uniref:hypothetical protein n=1 Tax=Paracoccus sp. S3-43 TaxID=3030011 RepID=UPI0023AE7C48|nr:hypothetical protein [Paracoccus sp. S3-43]WEF24484.1 hypothetical protein PXD02_00490 [Paracoccus sp. S3-43]